MHFELPDIADFPENEAPRNDAEVPFEGSFAHAMQALIPQVMAFGDFNAKQQSILARQVDRITQTANLYAKASQAPRAGNGILADTQDTSVLRRFFRPEINQLTQAPVQDVSVHEIDSTLTKTDAATREAVEWFLGDRLLWASEYIGRPVRVNTVTVQLSRPGDQHHYQTFRDCKTTTELLNLHMDPKPGLMKALIYLEADDGYFQYIPGSNHWEYDEIERIFAWGNSVGNYCHTPDHRKVANAFPKRFRKNAIVGRLIPDGTETSRFLLDQLVTYKDNVLLFDPVYGLHRGGLCQQGQRIALRVILK